MQTHFTLRPLDRTQPNSYVLLAVEPSEQAILFIHGYKGDAIATWSDFDALLQQAPTCGGTDVYFYGYDGLFSDLIASADIFSEFLTRLMTAPEALIDIPARHVTAYQRITLVGHSLGSVIARLALLHCRERGAKWLDCIELVLFAPAHKGAHVQRLAAEVLGGFAPTRWLPAIAKFKSPLVRQLEVGSNELTYLEQKTMAALATDGQRSYLKAKRVVIAERENIVSNIPFAADDPAIAIRGTTHTSVCKPSSQMPAALNHLLDCI